MSGNNLSTSPPDGVEPPSSTYHAKHDRADGPLSTGVFDAIADALELDPATNPIPVNDHISPDGLDKIFQKTTGESYLVFPVWDLRVVVHSDGRIFVHPPE